MYTIIRQRHSDKTAVRKTGTRWYLRCRLAALSFLTTASLASGADYLVTTVNDSGAGSLRLGLSSTVAGDTLQFQSVLDGTTLLNSSPLTISHSVTFMAPTAITLIDNHKFLLPDSITTTSPATTTLNPLTIDWKGTLTLNGILADTTTGGSLVNSGIGTLVLTQANTFSGGTTINAGTIKVSNNLALGTGAFTVSSGAVTKTIILDNSVNLANNVTLGSALTVKSSAGTTGQLSGVISGTGSLIQLETGTLALSGANTFVGGISVENGGTIHLLSNAGLGTGTLSEANGMTLILGAGVAASNSITLGGSTFTTNVASGSSTLSGSITEGTATQLIKTGAGTLILTGTNSYSGGTLISQGILQGNSSSIVGNVTDNSSLVFNQTGTGTFAGNLSGTGTLKKSGAGTLIYSGTSTLATTTNVTSGDLQVTGSLAGPVNVSGSSSTLSGSGTVGSVTNDGNVQPGTSGGTIGTLTVNGNYAQPSDGTTQIKVNSTGNVPGTNNDDLNILGQAKLSGNLAITPIGGGTFLPGTHYTFLTATGGVSGQYAQTFSTVSAYGVNVTYGANDAIMTVQSTTSLQAAALNSNQSAVGKVLDQIAATGTGSLYPTVNTLGIQSPGVQRQGMNQLSGEMFGNLQTLGLQLEDVFQQRVTNTLVSNGRFLTGQEGGQSTSGDEEIRGQSPVNGTSLAGQGRTWFQSFGVSGNLRSDGNAASLNYGQGGGIFGTDLANDEDSRFGVAGGASYVGFTDGFGGKGQVGSYQVGIYGLQQDDLMYVLSSANYGYNSYSTIRNIAVASTSESLRANYLGTQIGAYGETGLKLNYGIVHVQPLFALQYMYLGQQGFSESGGVAGLNVGATGANSLRVNIGTRLLIDSFVGPRGAIWTPYTNLRFVSDVLDNNRIVTASFSGGPAGGSFTSQGSRIGQNYGVIGEGVEIRMDDDWSLFGGADLMFSQHLTTITGSLAIILRW